MNASQLVKLVNPVGVRAAAPVTRARRLATLEGKSIGFIDNMKPNANLFVQYVEDDARRIPARYDAHRAQEFHVEQAHR